MRTFYLRYLYAYYQVCAYLASHMDGQPDMQKHQSAADEYHRLWSREQIQ